MAQDSTLSAVVEAERAFSSLSEGRGVRFAFLTYLSEDAVVFRPEPVNGPDWYSQNPETGGVLTWEPVVAAVSRAGDLGYTTGPWVLREAGDGGAIFGEYVSIWRKRPGGRWRVAVDAGTVHPGPGEPFDPPGALKSETRSAFDRREDPAKSHSLLVDAVRNFSRACAREGFVAAYARYANEGIRLLRMGALPAPGKRAAYQIVAGEVGTPSFQPMGVEVSSSGDLGYSYGTSGRTFDDGRPETAASYLWIWARSQDGGWRIVLDIVVPHALANDDSGG